MTTPEASNWSVGLQLQTRHAIEQIPVTSDGCLNFKHPTLGYAYATLDDLIHERLVLRSKTGSDEHRFDQADALLQAGWAVD